MRRCECGEPRPPCGGPCARCEASDGRTLAEAEIIHGLRLRGRATIEELAFETGYAVAHLRREVRRLAARGRVGRRRDETDDGNGLRWLYFLLS